MAREGAPLAPHFASAEEARPLRFEGAHPRTIYPCVSPETCSTERFSMGVEDVDANSEIPWHSHPMEEIVFIVRGRAEAHLEGPDGLITRPLAAESVLWVPPNMRHRIANVGDAPLRITYTFSPPPAAAPAAASSSSAGAAWGFKASYGEGG